MLYGNSEANIDALMGDSGFTNDFMAVDASFKHKDEWTIVALRFCGLGEAQPPEKQPIADDS